MQRLMYCIAVLTPRYGKNMNNINTYLQTIINVLLLIFFIILVFCDLHIYVFFDFMFSSNPSMYFHIT